MSILSGILGLIIIYIILQDAFETIVLPRRGATLRIRLTRLFYTFTWLLWGALAKWIRSSNRREYYLSLYGPLSLLLLLIVWAVGLIISFALLQWALGSMLNAPEGSANFGTDLYMSGTTFFTLGLG